MTIEERDNCLVSGASILAKDLDAIAAEMYSGENLHLVDVDGFSLSELFTLLRRVVKQLIHELKTDSWKILPDKFTDPHTGLTAAQQGSVLITKQISYIDDALEEGAKFENWLPETLLLVRYEMHYGFWDRSTTRVHNPDDLNLAKTQADAELLLESIRVSLQEVDDIQKKFQNNISELNQFTNLKTSQFDSLDKALESVEQSVDLIKETEKEASTRNGKIGVLLEQTDKTLDASRKKIAQDRKTFNEIQEQIGLLADSSAQKVNELSGYSQIFEDIINSASEKKQHILDQEKRIMTLIGFAADGTLGGVFDRRKKELEKTAILWIALSFAAVFAALGWAHYIFTSNPIKDANGVNWGLFVANAIRTSPLFIFVFFCLARYSRERNIQEEYAHKAAVSMTVTAYADMIGTGEVNERVKMLMDTIQRIYTPPTLDKPAKPLSLNSKHLAQATKNMADATGNLKTTVADTIKSLKSDKVDKAEKPE